MQQHVHDLRGKTLALLETLINEDVGIGSSADIVDQANMYLEDTRLTSPHPIAQVAEGEPYEITNALQLAAFQQALWDLNITEIRLATPEEHMALLREKETPFKEMYSVIAPAFLSFGPIDANDLYLQLAEAGTLPRDEYVRLQEGMRHSMDKRHTYLPCLLFPVGVRAAAPRHLVTQEQLLLYRISEGTEVIPAPGVGFKTYSTPRHQRLTEALALEGGGGDLIDVHSKTTAFFGESGPAMLVASEGIVPFYRVGNDKLALEHLPEGTEHYQPRTLIVKSQD